VWIDQRFRSILENGWLMKKLRIYIDTSVVGGCFDKEFEEASNILIDMATKDQVYFLVSNLLLIELQMAPPQVRAVLDNLPKECYEVISSNPETEFLRDAYLSAGVVGKNSLDDAHHVALATVYKADLIVSWNFKHIVHYDKIRGFNSVNLREGYQTIEIRSPQEVIPYD
jgi:predicted nucleic acid-binding protein